MGQNGAKERPERPRDALNLARLGHHQAVPLDADVLGVTRAARPVVDPRAAGIGVEGPALMGGLLFLGRHVASVTDHAAVRIASLLADRQDLTQHPRPGLADRLDPIVAGETAFGFAFLIEGHRLNSCRCNIGRTSRRARYKHK